MRIGIGLSLTRPSGGAGAWSPADLPGLAPTVQVVRSLAAGGLWQNAAKTTPCAADGDPCRVAVCPDTAGEYAAPSDGARGLLWDEGAGAWSLALDGVSNYYATPAATDGCVAWGFAWLNSTALESGFWIVVSPLNGLEFGLFASDSGYRNVSLMMGGAGASVGFDSAAVLAADAWNVLVVSYQGGGVSTPGNYRAWLNGVEQTVVASGMFGGGAVGTLGSRGGSYPAPIRIAGFVPSSAALSAAQAAAMSDYLTALTP